MAKKKQKYYVVWEGYKPGVYLTWDECNAQIKGYAGAKFKSYTSLDAAKQAFGESFSDHIGTTKKAKVIRTIDHSDVIWESLSVDAACSGSPGVMEYRGVWTGDAAEVFRMGPYNWGTNNVGEFLALIHGLAFLQKNGMEEIPIYSDSRTAMSWLRNKKIKTTLERRSSNVILFQLMERAEKWMKTNTWKTPVMKWETSRWGEIPADFGRK